MQATTKVACFRMARHCVTLLQVVTALSHNCDWEDKAMYVQSSIVQKRATQVLVGALSTTTSVLITGVGGDCPTT